MLSRWSLLIALMLACWLPVQSVMAWAPMLTAGLGGGMQTGSDCHGPMAHHAISPDHTGMTHDGGVMVDPVLAQHSGAEPDAGCSSTTGQASAAGVHCLDCLSFCAGFTLNGLSIRQAEPARHLVPEPGPERYVDFVPSLLIPPPCHPLA